MISPSKRVVPDSNERLIRLACATTFFGRGGSSWLILRERDLTDHYDIVRVARINATFPW